MSWHCSAAAAGDFSLDTYLAGLRSAESRLKSTLEKPCSNGSETGCYQPSLFGTTFAPLTAGLGEASSMSSQADSPAKTSAERVKVRDLPERVRAFGLKCSELLRKYNLSLSSRKTVRTFVPRDSAPLSKDLPAWGMMSDGGCWELGMRALRIDGTGCGSMLPTPIDPTKGGGTSRSGSRRNECPSLHGMARHNLWPTPTVTQRPNEGNVRLLRKKCVAGELSWDEAKALAGKDVREAQGIVPAYWPTPTANEDACGTPNGKMQKMLGNHPEVRSSGKGTLNPDWVCWLMQWPVGWASCEPLHPSEFALWEDLTRQGTWWDESGDHVCPRVAEGIKGRAKRLKALGNGQVPLVAVMAWEVLHGLG